jgi:hypothetical protein
MDVCKQASDRGRSASDRARHHAPAGIPHAASRIYPRGGGERWKPGRPYHVALEDSYIRAHWDEIDALCKLNSIPFNASGEKIRDAGLWHVCEFTWQLIRTLVARQ